jgi:biotin/methionine sulfoxide reductase
MRTLTAMHWGVYEAEVEDGRPVLRPFREDPSPSPIGLDALSDDVARLRVRRPAFRKSWLDHGPGQRTERRGSDPFVELDWDEASKLVSGELKRVLDAHGNGAIFGGSYGWSSAGRFHHAQSQVHRFLNALGGYVRSVDTYSLGAARVAMPHIVASMEELMAIHTSWDVVEHNTKLFVCFGGIPAKNAQVSSGGAFEHRIPGALRRLGAAGVRFVNVSPVRDDLDTGAPIEWIPIRPGTDTALLLALMHTLYTENLHDPAFLARYGTGFERFVPYLTGGTDGQPKDAAWASAITEVPAARIVTLAREMAATRTMVNIAWSLQRAQHGEQPYWALVTLACMLGQIGLPGGGFGVGYGAVNLMGSPHPRFGGPTLPQGGNKVRQYIPVARIADMLLNPGAAYDYNGSRLTYPDIRLIYWAGGNPFHHHQDLNRLRRAWAKPETIVVHEQFWTAAARTADIVLPATTALEREDIGFANREPHLIAMRRLSAPVGEARDDYAIFSDLARRLGREAAYTENRTPRQWLETLYEQSRTRAKSAGVDLPPFAEFWEAGLVTLPRTNASNVMLEDFRSDPEAHPLKTPSGKIEIFNAKVAGFGYDDCPGHPVWRAPTEWLGAAGKYALHLLSDQPSTRLHSQLDHAPHSRGAKIAGRQPVTINPADAAARRIADGDVVRLFNDRGACLAGAVVSDVVRPGVVRLSTGSWFDPASWEVPGALEKNGNPNVLTLDVGASRLSQGCTAQTCLVEIEKWHGEAPRVTAYDLPQFVTR